jgi:hypothetical protein
MTGHDPEQEQADCIVSCVGGEIFFCGVRGEKPCVYKLGFGYGFICRHPQKETLPRTSFANQVTEESDRE